MYGKKKHFNAADRIKGYHFCLGLPLIIVNALTGSVLVYVLVENAKNSVRYVPLVLSLIATLLATLQTFFNFARCADDHRRIANRYLAIMKVCDRVQAYVADKLVDKDELVRRVESVAADIQQVNLDAEALPTTDEDYRKAQEGVEAGEEEYTQKDLEI